MLRRLGSDLLHADATGLKPIRELLQPASFGRIHEGLGVENPDEIIFPWNGNRNLARDQVKNERSVNETSATNVRPVFFAARIKATSRSTC